MDRFRRVAFRDTAEPSVSRVESNRPEARPYESTASPPVAALMAPRIRSRRCNAYRVRIGPIRTLLPRSRSRTNRRDTAHLPRGRCRSSNCKTMYPSRTRSRLPHREWRHPGAWPHPLPGRYRLHRSRYRAWAAPCPGEHHPVTHGSNPRRPREHRRLRLNPLWPGRSWILHKKAHPVYRRA